MDCHSTPRNAAHAQSFSEPHASTLNVHAWAYTPNAPLSTSEDYAATATQCNNHCRQPQQNGVQHHAVPNTPHYYPTKHARPWRDFSKTINVYTTGGPGEPSVKCVGLWYPVPTGGYYDLAHLPAIDSSTGSELHEHPQIGSNFHGGILVRGPNNGGYIAYH